MKPRKLAFLGLMATIAIIGTTEFTACDQPNNNTPANQAPTANAGNDFEHNITASGTTVTLNGSGTDSDGTITAYAWTCTDKPNGSADPSFSNSAIASPTVSGFTMLGDYEFSLTVKDNENKESTADMVTVSLVRTASASINVPSIPFSATYTLDFDQTYTGYNADFPSGCVTSKIADDKGNNDLPKQVTNTYCAGTDVSFIQTFFYNNQSVDSRSFRTMMGNGLIAALHDGTTWIPTGAIPEINLTLTKKVTAGAITP